MERDLFQEQDFIMSPFSWDQDSYIPHCIKVEMYCKLLTSAQEPLNIGNEFTLKNLWSFTLCTFKQRLYQR
jgi:hypothetical protein